MRFCDKCGLSFPCNNMTSNILSNGWSNTPAGLVRTNDGVGLSGSKCSNIALTPANVDCIHFNFGNSYTQFPIHGGSAIRISRSCKRSSEISGTKKFGNDQASSSRDKKHLIFITNSIKTKLFTLLLFS